MNRSTLPRALAVALAAAFATAARAQLPVNPIHPAFAPLDAAGRFRVTIPYGARFTLRAHGRREVNGRMRESFEVSMAIGRNDRDRDVQLVLRVPQ